MAEKFIGLKGENERMKAPALLRLVGGIAFAAVVFVFLGCGGGGGGGSGGTGVDPVEVEIRAALDSFLAAVASENATGTRALLAPNLKYFRSGGATPEGIDVFMGRMTVFYGKAASVSIELQDLGVSPMGETVASTRGTLVCRYRNASGTEQTLQEEAEIILEKNFFWQINSISRFNQVGMAFPP